MGLVWKFNRKHGATGRIVRSSERAAMLGDDPVGQCESDAVPLRFGREEGNEDLR